MSEHGRVEAKRGELALGMIPVSWRSFLEISWQEFRLGKQAGRKWFLKRPPRIK